VGVKGFYSQEEREHYDHLSNDVKTYLKLADKALVITSEGLALQGNLRTDEPKTLILLFLAKAIKYLRCSIINLKLGYYSGASVILRSALETYLYVVLFYDEPKYIADWYRIEAGLDKRQNIRERQKLISASKKALRKMEGANCNIIDSELSDFHKRADKRAHVSLMGLSEEFDLGFFEILPSDLANAQTKEYLETVLENYSRLDTLQGTLTNPNNVYEDKPIFLGIHYEEAFLLDLSLYTFYISHRVLDLVQAIYEIKDESFQRHSRIWHSQVEKGH
jgi:hypothetical protein